MTSRDGGVLMITRTLIRSGLDVRATGYGAE